MFSDQRIAAAVITRKLPLELAALKLRNHFQGFLDIGIIRFQALGDEQFPLTLFDSPRAAIDQTQVLVKVALRLAVSADLYGFLQLSYRLVPVPRAGGGERKIAQRVGSLGDSPFPLQLYKTILVLFGFPRIGLAQVTRQII